MHEEDNGLLFKHTYPRDDSTIVTKARKFIIRQIFTAANYEYTIQVCIYVDFERQKLTSLSAVDFPCKHHHIT